MLSRVADSLYWMSRHLERAEHTARLIDVNLNLMLEQFPDPTDRRWKRLLTSLRTPPADTGAGDAYKVIQLLTFDLANNSSIEACLAAAREHARQVREKISSEMWEQLNQFFLQVKRSSIEDLWNGEPHAFFQAVKAGVHLFQGITDATMSYSESWHFIQLGRFLERADETAALLDGYGSIFVDREQQAAGSSDYLEWVGLLKSCTAFEAYCKVYTANLRPDRIAEFLLLNAEFPRSVRFAANRIQVALQAIAEATEETRRAKRVGQLAGRLRAALDFGQVDEIMSSGLHAYLRDIRDRCAHLHTAFYKVYIDYPIESALAP